MRDVLLFAVLLALGAAIAADAQQALPATKGHGGGGSSGLTDVAFQGSGLLVNYYAGASWALQKGKVIVPGKTKLAGLSGGAYTSVVNALGWTGPEQKALWDASIKTLMLDVQRPGYLNALMYAVLGEKLPADVSRKINGYVKIAVSQLNAAKKTFEDSASWVISSFVDKRDVIAALTTTNMIPCFSALSTYGIFRNQPVIDGSFGNGFKELCLGNADKCVKVAAWVVGDLASDDCTVACRGEVDFANGCAIEHRLTVRTQMYKNGKYVDRWPITEVQGRCPWPTASDPLFQGRDPYPLPPHVPQDQVTPDIYPGKYNPLPQWQGREMLACEWLNWALAAPSDPAEVEEMLNLVYEQGYMDARSYLETVRGISIDADPY